MRPLSLLLVGVGHDHACVIYDTILRRSDLFRVTGFTVPPEEREVYADRIQKYEAAFGVPCLSFDEACTGAEAAVIEAEEKNLTRYAAHAAACGLHVHMDKPGGFSLSAFDALLSAVREKKLAFGIGYMYRFNPHVRDALKSIRAGEIGEVYAIHAEMSCEHPKEKRAWLRGLPGGMMFFLGCHLIDLVYQIQGAPEEIVPLSAETESGVGTDFGCVAYRYPHGTTVIRASANEAGGFMSRRLSVYGTKGTVTLFPIEAYDFANAKDGRDSYSVMQVTQAGGGWCSAGEPQKTPLYNRYEDMMTHFYRMAAEGEAPLVSLEYERNLYELLLKTVGCPTEEGKL